MKVCTYKMKYHHEAGVEIQILSLPQGSEILCFKVGKKSPYILVLQEDNPKEFVERKFIIAQNDQNVINNEYYVPAKYEIVKHYGTDFVSGTANHLFEVARDWS